MLRGSSWGAMYSALRPHFFGKRACNMTWVMGQGVAGTMRALMLVAKVGDRSRSADCDCLALSCSVLSLLPC